MLKRNLYAALVLITVLGLTTNVLAAPKPPNMGIEGNAVPISDGNTTPDLGNHTDFGSTEASVGTINRTFTITNIGGNQVGDLTLTGTPDLVQITGTHAADFTVVTPPASSIPRNTTTTFTIQFAPSAIGLRSATVTIPNNSDDTRNPYEFAIQGTGDPPPVSAPTISNPTASSITHTTATLSIDVDADGGDSISQHGTFWNDTGPPVTQNQSSLGPYGGAIPGSFTDPVINLTPGSQIFFRGYATNTGGTTYTADVSFYTEPADQATNVTFTNVLESSMTINWVRGTPSGGDAVIVVVRENAAAEDPADGTEYTANNQFPLGSLVGTGTRVVYIGTGTSVNVTSLSAGKTYHVAVYEYAGTGSGWSGINYKQTGAPTNSQLIAGPPSLSNPTVTNALANSATLGATIDTDGGDAVSERGVVWNTTGSPTTLDANNSETGTWTAPPIVPFTLPAAGLSPQTQYYFRGYAINIEGISYSPEAAFWTEPATQASAVNFTNVTDSSMQINWTRGSGTGSLVVVKEDAPVDGTPTDGTEHSFDGVFGIGQDLGGGNYVVYRGAGASVNVTSLLPGRTYHVAVYEYAGSGTGQGGINYLLPGAPTNSQLIVGLPTLILPTAASVEATTATLGATVDSDGGGALSARGTVWNTTGSPNIVDDAANAVAQGGTTAGLFTHARVGLPEGTRIFYRGYATNAFGTAYTQDAIFYTEPATPATNVVFTDTSYNRTTVSWTPGSGVGSIVIMKVGLHVDTDPTDGVEHDAVSAFGSGEELGTGNFVLYRGTGTQVTVSDLNALTHYYVKVYAFAGGGTGVNYQESSPAIGTEQTLQGPIGHNYNNSIQCDECHAMHSSLVPRGTEQVTACVDNCHYPGGPASDKSDVALHSGGMNVDCGACHEAHSGVSSQAVLTTYDIHTDTTQQNLALIRGDISKYFPDALEPAVYHDANTFSYDEANPPWNGVCQTCHMNTDHHRNHADPNTDHTHPAEMSGSAGKICTDCHAHVDGFAPSISPDQSCQDPTCHGDIAGSRREVVSEFGLTSHHAGAATDEDCAVCHYEAIDDAYHFNDGLIDLRDPDDGTDTTLISITTLTRNTSSDVLEPNAVAVQDNFCMKCHDSDGATATAFDANFPLQPFSDACSVPNVFDQFDPTNDFHHAVRAPASNPYTVQHSGYITMMPPWNQDTTHDMITCFDCHQTNGHGTANQRMLLTPVDFDAMEDSVGGTYPSTLKTEVKNFCAMCHDPYIYADSGGNVAGSAFEYHAPGQNGHFNGNDLACFGCHAGIVDEDKDGTITNGAARGLIHGGSFTWPTGSPSPGVAADTFVVGGWMSGWLPSGGSVDCWGGECNHDKSPKSYTPPAP